MMKRTFFALLIVLGAAQCTWTHSVVDRAKHGENPYINDPYYARYLNTGSRTDQHIREHLASLAENPDSAPLHNELGALLVEKQLLNDAETEFRRAIAADKRYYPAWFNLAQVRESRGNYSGAERAFEDTLDVKPGHPDAHFRLGLLLERRGKRDAAIDHYARAIKINRQVLDVRKNPRVLDSQLLHLALLALYPEEHARRSAGMEGTPAGWVDRSVIEEESVSPEASPEEIVSPAPAPTDPAAQPPRPKG
jgi:tetratricopeptide (TPR) repeat protein